MRRIAAGFWLGVWLLELLVLVLVLGLWCVVLPIAIVVLVVGEGLHRLAVGLAQAVWQRWPAGPSR